MTVADVSIRLIHPDDATRLAQLEAENRDYLSFGGPVRSDEYVTVAGQTEAIARALEEHAAGRIAPYVIELGGVVVGRITLNGIIRGPAQSANVGYWVAQSVAGRGVTSAALALLVEHAFGELGLHRLEAGTTLTNEASAKVLLRAGFEEYGVARSFLLIRGRWEDHRLFQLVNDAWTAPA